MSLRIREFLPSDIEVVVRLVSEMQEYERAIDGRLLPGSEMAIPYTAEMRDLCAREDGVILLAEVDGEVAGFVAVRAAVPSEELDHPPGTYALISDLSVSAAFRGRGVGRALLEAAERHAQRRGAVDLRIAVLAANSVANGLYRSAGFSPYLVVLTKDLSGLG